MAAIEWTAAVHFAYTSATCCLVPHTLVLASIDWVRSAPVQILNTSEALSEWLSFRLVQARSGSFRLGQALSGLFRLFQARAGSHPVCLYRSTPIIGRSGFVECFHQFCIWILVCLKMRLENSSGIRGFIGDLIRSSEIFHLTPWRTEVNVNDCQLPVFNSRFKRFKPIKSSDHSFNLPSSWVDGVLKRF